MFETEYSSFMKYFFYLLIIFSIITYIIIYTGYSTQNIKIFNLNKACFYIFILFILLIINDILDTKLQFLWKFVFIIISALILVYISNNLLINRYNKGYWKTLGLSLLSTIFILIFISIIVYTSILGKGNKISDPIFLQFNYAVYENFSFLIYTLFYFAFTKSVMHWLDFDTYLTDIVSTAIYGLLILAYLFQLVIYIAIKIKLITSIQQLNTYISIFSFIFFLGIIQIYFFMSGIQSVCEDKDDLSSSKENSDMIERLTLILLFSIVVVLWLDDSRKWLQIEYLLFIVATLIIISCIFYYSTKYPSISIISLWGFIEWLILICYNKHDTWNSVNFVMLNTKYNLKRK